MKTVHSPHFAEIEEKNSRFLAYLVPFEIFDETLARLRDEHPKANHHVTASRHFDTDKRLHESAKDDGEPSGTSGMPALKVLQGSDLVNIGVIIVRYFGGTKLGTGGLARAYGGAAKAAVDTADLSNFAHQKQVTLAARFDRISDLERLLGGAKVTIQNRDYTASAQEVTISGDEEIIIDLEERWAVINY